MKRVAFLVGSFLIALFTPGPALAACRMLPPGQTCGPGEFPQTYTLTIAGTAQCTSGTNGTYSVCCDEKTEANSVDSVRAPLCGSSEERGKANSTCWQCEGDIRCDGADFALGESDDFMFLYRQSIDGSPTDNVWRVPKDKILPEFTYNGMKYKKNGGLVMCKANNLACGADPEKTYCQNIKHPDIDNRGNSGTSQQQCVEIKTTDPQNDPEIRMGKRSWVSSPTLTSADYHLLTNIQGNNDAARGPQLSTLFGSPDTNPTITGLYQVNLNDGQTPIAVDNRSNWGATLIELQATGNDILAPVSGYDIGGGFHYTVLYASPTELTLKATREDNAVYGYTLHFADINVDQALLEAYRNNETNRSNQLIAIPCGFKIGEPKDSKVKVAVTDSGTYMDPRVEKDWWNIPAGDTCASHLGIGHVEPLTTKICTTAETGVPDMTTKIRIPNLVTFGQSNAVKDKNGSVFSVFSGIKEEVKRSPIGKYFGFKDNKVEVPKVYERLGRQLKGALPYLTPAAVKVQPIVHEITHSGASTYCYANDKKGGKTQAFPIKGTITIPAPGLNMLRESSRMLAGFTAPTVSIPKFEYEHLGELNPNVLAKINLNPACDEPPTSFKVRQKQVGSSDPEEYDVPDEDVPVYFRSIRIPDFKAILAAFFGKKCGDADCNLPQEPQESHVRFKIKTPYIIPITKDLIKDQTGKPVGALATLQPASLQTRGVKPGKTEGNIMFQQLGSSWGDDTVTLNYRNARSIEQEGEQLTNCLIHPLSLQHKLDYDCNFSDEQHGKYPVPTELSSAMISTWPEAFREGILGKDFLRRYASNLITTGLSEEQRAIVISKVQALIDTYVSTGTWEGSQLANVDYQRQIHEAAQAYGLNEAFLYTLWIEETHASSVGDYPFGCGNFETFEGSLGCITTNPTVQTYIRDDLYDALCMYADGHRNCTFEAHPNFVRNLMYYYDYLTTP